MKNMDNFTFGKVRSKNTQWLGEYKTYTTPPLLLLFLSLQGLLVNSGYSLSLLFLPLNFNGLALSPIQHLLFSSLLQLLRLLSSLQCCFSFFLPPCSLHLIGSTILTFAVFSIYANNKGPINVPKGISSDFFYNILK